MEKYIPTHFPLTIRISEKIVRILPRERERKSWARFVPHKMESASYIPIQIFLWHNRFNSEIKPITRHFESVLSPYLVPRLSTSTHMLSLVIYTRRVFFARSFSRQAIFILICDDFLMFSSSPGICIQFKHLFICHKLQ